MTATEPQQDGTNPRKKLYSALVGNANPEAKSHFKQFSFEQFNKRLDDEKFVEDLYQSLRDNDVVLDAKNRQPEQNYYDFLDAYVKAKPAAPAAKPAAPVAAPVPVAPIEQAAPIPSAEPMGGEEISEVEYEGKMLPEVTVFGNLPQPGTQEHDEIIRSNPPVGSDEYSLKLAVQNQRPAIELGPGGYGGGLQTAFTSKEQPEQERLSQLFKRQKLAEAMFTGEIPTVTQEDVNRAQRGFAKATKEQQQAAIMGSSGFEYEQEKKAKERGKLQYASDLVGSWADSGNRMAKNMLSAIGHFAQTQAATDPMANLPYEKRQEMLQQAGQTMYKNATAAQNTFQQEIAKRNIQTSVLQAIEKGDYSRIPESTLYTVGDAAMQIIPAIFSFGASTYMQTLPQAYKDGVDAIAKEKGISPEQVVASGDDAIVVSEINAGAQSLLDYAGAGLVSKGIASKGGYKAMRDWLLNQNVNRNLARGAALLGVATGEAATEYGQEVTGQIGKTAAKSPTAKAFFDKLPNELFTPEARKQRQEALVGGFVGGLGLVGGGQFIGSAMDRTLFEAPKIGKATQRPDMDVVQLDNKIQERNKIVMAMEEAVKANPEAEGQIRQQYQKRIKEAAPADNEVLMAYESLALLPETDEKNTIRENLEAYMAEKGIQPETAGMEAGLGELMRVEAPAPEVVAPEVVAPPIAPQVAPEVAPIEEAPTEEVLTEEAIPIEEDEDLAALNEQIAAIENAPAEREMVPAAPSVQFETPKLALPRLKGFAPYLRKLGYTDEEISGMTIDQQQDIAINKTEPARAESSSKVDVAKENQRVERIAEAQKKLDEEIAAEQAAPVAAEEEVVAAPAKEIGVGGIIKGHEDIVGNKGLGDIRNELPEDNSGTILVTGKDNNQYAVAFSRKGGDRQNIFEQTTTPRPGHIYTSVKIDNPSNAQEVEAAKRQAEAALSNILPTITKGNIRASDVKQAILDFQAQKPAEAPKPAPVTPPVAKGDVEGKTETDRHIELLNSNPKTREEAERIVKEVMGESEFKEAIRRIEFLASGALTKHYNNDFSYLKEAAKQIEKLKPKTETKPAPVTTPAPKEEKKEEKPTTETPQEGDTVDLPPQSKYSTTPRKMVFKDGQWKQEVGGEITSVGQPVQKQAQEAFSGKTEAKAEETKPAPKAPETKPAETKPAEFTSKQESSASEEFDGTKKPSKIKMKTFDGKHGKGAFERMQNITQNFEDIMDGLSEKIKQDCL